MSIATKVIRGTFIICLTGNIKVQVNLLHQRILLCLFSKKSVKINRSVGNSFSAKSISDYLKSEHHSIDNETLSKNAANALAEFCICFVKKCHTLQMDFSYFEYGRKQSFHTFFIANPK